MVLLCGLQVKLLRPSKEKVRQDVSSASVLRIIAWPQVSLALSIAVGMTESVTVESAVSIVGDATQVKVGGASALAKSLPGPCSTCGPDRVGESIRRLHSPHLVPTASVNLGKALVLVKRKSHSLFFRPQADKLLVYT